MNELKRRYSSCVWYKFYINLNIIIQFEMESLKLSKNSRQLFIWMQYIYIYVSYKYQVFKFYIFKFYIRKKFICRSMFRYIFFTIKKRAHFLASDGVAFYGHKKFNMITLRNCLHNIQNYLLYLFFPFHIKHWKRTERNENFPVS